MPCFNERATVRTILNLVAAAPLVSEIIVVDDGSTDGTRDLLRDISSAWPSNFPQLRVVFQPENRGKGAALRTGFRHATGDLVVVQDADLEYDPQEYATLVRPIVERRTEVVYGSRFSGPLRRPRTWHSLVNRLLTLLSNLTTGLRLTDMETCYKVFRTELIRSVTIDNDRFAFEPEITAKVARRGCRILEVPISYRRRSHAEGKKIGWKDGVEAVWVILKYGLTSFGRLPRPPGPAPR